MELGCRPSTVELETMKLRFRSSTMGLETMN
jgi:hypothetical protein